MIEDISPGSTRPTPTTQHRRFEYDPTDSHSISVSIIRAVASVSGSDPLSLEPRLYDVIDPDALERLLTADATSSEVRITFLFGNHEVTVTAAGEIIVRDDPTPSC